jgi:hypothetical protein
MRRMAFLLIAALVLALSAAPAALAQANDQNCEDFESQAAAQAHLRQDPSDPDGLDALPGPADGNDDRDAGGHGDGVACEDHPYPPGTPRDETPVGQDTGGDDDTGGNGELPFTGPNDTLLPAGMALLVAGLALVGVTRYRARHARR